MLSSDLRWPLASTPFPAVSGEVTRVDEGAETVMLELEAAPEELTLTELTLDDLLALLEALVPDKVLDLVDALATEVVPALLEALDSEDDSGLDSPCAKRIPGPVISRVICLATGPFEKRYPDL